MKIKFIIAFLFIASFSFGQSAEVDKIIQTGNDFYKQQKYDAAAAEYQKAIEKDPNNSTAKFNLATTLSKQGKQSESARAFTEIGDNSKDKDLKEKAYYNKGAIYSQQKRLEESIEAYKKALRQNPEDKEARENLQKALLELKKKTPPPKKDNKKQNNQQKQDQKMDRKEAEQRLKLLEQKEKEVQQRLQKEKSKAGGSQTKDW